MIIGYIKNGALDIDVIKIVSMLPDEWVLKIYNHDIEDNHIIDDFMPDRYITENEVDADLDAMILLNHPKEDLSIPVVYKSDKNVEKENYFNIANCDDTATFIAGKILEIYGKANAS